MTANPGKPKIIVCLYQSFPQLTNCLRQHEDLFKQLNFIILDESHYLGESNCEKVIVDAMSQYKHLKQLNFSATPTAEQKKDTIFRYTYLDGVVDDILQPFDIHVTFKEIESELIEVPKDGNCFFHCLAHTLSFSSSSFNNILKSHSDIRKELIDFSLRKKILSKKTYVISKTSKSYIKTVNGITKSLISFQNLHPYTTINPSGFIIEIYNRLSCSSHLVQNDMTMKMTNVCVINFTMIIMTSCSTKRRMPQKTTLWIDIFIIWSKIFYKPVTTK